MMPFNVETNEKDKDWCIPKLFVLWIWIRDAERVSLIDRLGLCGCLVLSGYKEQTGSKYDCTNTGHTQTVFNGCHCQTPTSGFLTHFHTSRWTFTTILPDVDVEGGFTGFKANNSANSAMVIWNFAGAIFFIKTKLILNENLLDVCR